MNREQRISTRTIQRLIGLLVAQADVEFVALLPSTAEVTFIGSYRPPARPVGAKLDRVLLRYVAESSVRSFLADLIGAETLHSES